MQVAKDLKMPSPFPGMNPYLEQPSVWHDFHQSFIPVLRGLLAEQVRPNYLVKLEEQVYIHQISEEECSYLGRPDVSLLAGRGKEFRSNEMAAALFDAPHYGQLPAVTDTERLSYIEVVDRDNLELITVIELLSPSNKKLGGDREQYLVKRRELIASSVHLVEIDLLRGGTRMPVEDLPDCDYCVLVSRSEDRPRVGLWPIRLRETLPEIPIPLRSPDPDARVSLKEVLDRVYDSAGYADYIYQGKPHPPLHPADAEWAKEFILQIG